MSKLFKKLSGVSLGLALCFGFSFSCSNKSSGQMARAAGDSVTFTPNNCTDMTSAQTEQTQTINPITFTISNGMNSGQLRIYKSATATFTAASGYNITSIEFTCTASGTTKYGPGCFADLTGYTYSGFVGTWTGLASSVAFTASSNQVRASQIVVEYASASSNPTVNVDDSLTLNVAETSGKTLTATTELISNPVYSWTTNDNNITLEDASSSTVRIKPNTTSAGSATVSLNVSGTNSTTNANVSIDKEISVTLEEPLTVSEALALVANADSNTTFEGKYVKVKSFALNIWLVIL